jgi:exodeoxyribonuclease VIII
MYPDMMVDIESFSTNVKAQVVSIGAFRFRLDTSDDLNTIKDPERSFYAVLDTEEQEADGRITDPDTMAWWDRQSMEARAVLREPFEEVKPALERFAEFARGVRRVWGNGNTFDNVIVRDLCNDYNVEYPVKYWGDLDMRTLKYLWNRLTNWAHKGKTKKTIGDAHNALDDARSQVMQLQEMYRDLKGTRYGA